MRQPVGDVLFTIAAWALVAYAGRVLFGPIEGIAFWRSLFGVAAAAGVIGIVVGGRSHAPRRRRLTIGEGPSWLPPAGDVE